MTLRSLLSILADGKFHSGRELGEEIGISRSAIWKHVRRIEESGLEVYSVKGRGYRVPGGVELLDYESIQKHLQPEVANIIRCSDIPLQISSTNEVALRESQTADCHGNLYAAEQQTQGRGRRGRSWASPFAKNLYFSLVWRFEQGAAALEGLSLLVGLSLVKALQALSITGVELKWPNDLLYQGQKLAGILIELNGEASGQCQAVIGVGINIDMPKDQAEAIDQPWTDLETIAGAKVGRNRLLAEILNQLVGMLSRFERQGFSELAQEWQTYHAMQDKPIILQVGDKAINGLCRGVDESGALLLETDEGTRAYHGGEVSVQRNI